ncbi:V-type ATP synthase subunit I [Brucepastera parasyntrophica]|uniref:V-type ATP synthase subunit I n=1 Tax=Brucepastera parasyntrophica TaxID=2880008 RepID=UPI002109D960|nr:V-type ATPase 116kDa subunit family protein [Brucepastera parasyntrophica]ULQ59826.1 V-type ATP synthase subunit I [Brucepastera parasyntrophica]
MIVPMKKITLVVLDRERKQALTTLRKTGVLHVEKHEVSTQDLTDLQTVMSKLDQAHNTLSEIKTDIKKEDYKPLMNRADTLKLIDHVLELRDEHSAVFETMSKVERDFDRLAYWGEVDPSDFDYLAEKGLYLFPFEMSVASYMALPETVRSIVVSRDKKEIRCVIWGEDDLLHEDMPSGARELILPEKSTAELRAEYEKAEQRLPHIRQELKDLIPYINSISELKKDLNKDIEFEVVHSGMPLVPLGTDETDSKGHVAWLTGFIPEEKASVLAETAKQNGWAFMATDPSEEDNVPTLLKNNRFVNLISPLTDFLGTVPGYRELDISLWFLLFFGIFFAMIFGDGGYGALLILIALGVIFKTKASHKPVPTALYMMLYLSVMTLVWGILTCTWFGLDQNVLPAFLRNIALPAFYGGNPASETNIQIFCFTLGLIQISLAHVINIIRYRKSLKLLGDFGSLLMCVGMFFVVLFLVVDGERFPLNPMVIVAIGLGFVLNFVFANYEGSLGKGVLESSKNIITMLLGVVNMFGDIMSYIRLWAVGLAGGAISMTINTMVGPFMGSFLMFVGILILFFGHGLNLILNVLSVIVHGVRLNTLEFSNHLGLTWSGFKYEPFSEAVKK